MAFFASLVLGALVAVPQTQQQPQFQPPTFAKQSYKIQEENWVEYTVQMKYVKTTEMGKVVCSNPCKGKKHTLHSECDTSCDGACKEIHKYEFKPIVGCRPGGDLMQGGGKMGLPDITWDVVTAVGGKLEDATKGTEKNYDLKHWNKEPCSESARSQMGEVFQVSAAYQFFRNDPGPNGTKILVKGPSGTWDYGPVTIPAGDLTDPKVTVKCKCSVVEGDGQGSGIWIKKGGSTYVATSKIIEDMGINVVCDSMVSCTVTCTNTSTEACTVSVGPGTVFECQDGGVQNETCCEAVSFDCPALSTVRVPIRASVNQPNFMDWFLTSAKARAACINMTKHEPSSGDKFSFAMPADNTLVRLAAHVNEERFRGPLDQVRFWILTDHATREQMGKVLLPKPTIGMYLRALYEVNLYTGTDLTLPEFKACMDPGLSIGASATEESTFWFVKTWAAKDPKTLGNWLVKNTALLSEECFGADTAKDEAQHAADLFNALCATGNPELIEAAATCLTKAVPESKRRLLAEVHGLAGMMNQLTGADDKAASMAMDVAELYHEPLCKPSLLNVNDSHIEVLKRAEKLYKELGAEQKRH